MSPVPVPHCYGIIPARWQSSRFPGKPLTPILGKPMFTHVFERATACPDLRAVYLATDDERIAAAAREHNVPCIMTPADCVSGSDRVCRAALDLGLPDEAVIVNIQGDEPALDPAMLSELVRPFFVDPNVRVTTLAHILSPELAANPDRVKVVTDLHANALYFSRAPIPHIREHHAQPPCPLWGHVGLYAFTFETLRRFTALPPSPLEKLEQLEQLRLLENNIPIRVIETRYEAHGVDRPQDVAVLEKFLTQNRALFSNKNE
jgi:3-deoxy-manno-octulosonate cytidylyltransferase (CMP-KDO synthetase)